MSHQNEFGVIVFYLYNLVARHRIRIMSKSLFVPIQSASVLVIVLTIVFSPLIFHQNNFAQGASNAISSNENIAITNATTTTTQQPMSATANTTSMTTPTSISLPVSKGYVNGKIANFIATDASTRDIVSSVSNTTGFEVNYAPLLANTSELSRQQGFVFVNGIRGEGPLGSQLSVASATPEEEGYSPLVEINYVKWNSNTTGNIRILKSVEEITQAQKNGELTITKSNIVINSPAVPNPLG